MQLRKQIKYWLYRSIGLLVAVFVVSNSLTIDRVVAAQSSSNRSPTSNRPEVASNVRICPNNLNATLDPIVYNPTFAEGEWGILIQSLATKQVLYQYNPSLRLIPASNIKLLTTAAAIQTLPKLQPLDAEDWLRAIDLANRDSNNRQADLLLDRIGGVDVIKDSLWLLGVNPNTYQQVDGSGLSHDNLAAPVAFVNLLQGISRTRDSQVFYDSLSISGVNGTLRNRLADPIARGRVHAKTGTLTGVRSLSGYVQNPSYGTIVFSIILNQSGLPGRVMTDAIDEIVLDLAEMKKC
jgi:serine-type D-Ala-D-Ala carboxypeptidase/endopeptidase (penicillin-binding protein 4)